MPALLAIETGSSAGSSRRYVSVVVVGLLHVAVVYVLLTALQIIPNQLAPPPPFHVHVILQKVYPLPPMPPVQMAGTFIRPRVPPVSQPTINTERTPESPGPGNPTSESIPVQGLPTHPAHAIQATHTVPPYPSLALRLAHEGNVRLRLTITEQGRVAAAEILNSTGHAELDNAAVAWVQRVWRYQPAVQDGRPVPATAIVIVTFRLNQAGY